MKKMILICLIMLPLLTACNKEEFDSFGTIYGIVSDSSTGNPLGNATVILSPGGETKTTGNDGYFEFKDVTPRQYTVSVQKVGYLSNRKSITAIVGESVETNISLTKQ